MHVLCGASDYYSRKVRPDQDLILPAAGELIVIRSAVNECWYRALVRGCDLEHNVKVRCLFIVTKFIAQRLLL